MQKFLTTIILIISLSFNMTIGYFSNSTLALAQTQSQKVLQGNNFAKDGHAAFNQKNYLKAGEHYDKAYQITKTKVYLDNANVAYTSYAFELSNNKEYSKALIYANKVLSRDPQNRNVKILVSDIYFSQGIDYFYAGEFDKAKIEFNKSLNKSVLAEQKTRVQDALDKIKTISSGHAYLPQENQQQATSIPELINKMELKVNGKANTSKPLIERVNILEKSTLGQTYQNEGLVSRVDRLAKTLLPDFQPQPTSTASKLYANTYIPAIMDQSMGHISIFGKMPINVFIDNNPNVKPYKKYYKNAVLDAMKDWEKASDNKIKFQTTGNEMKADIKITWSENFEDFPWQPTLQKEDISSEKKKMKYRKANAIVQIGSVVAMVAGTLVGVPVIGALGGVGNGVASPLLQYNGMKYNNKTPVIKINVKITDGMSEDQAKIKIKQIALHQLGHSIGIIGHSPYPDDIMYENFTVNELSQRDINTIKEIYKSKDTTKEK